MVAILATTGRFRRSTTGRAVMLLTVRAAQDMAAPPVECVDLSLITSSARPSNCGGTVRPNAFAVLRLTTSSYFVGNCAGNSAGFAPLRTRSTYDAPSRHTKSVLVP